MIQLSDILKLKLTHLSMLSPEIFMLFSTLGLLLYLALGVGRYMHNYFFMVSYYYTIFTLLITFFLSVVVLIKVNTLVSNGIPADANFFLFNDYLALNIYVLFFKSLIIFMAIICCLISMPYFKNNDAKAFEYPLILNISIVGLLFLLSSIDLISFYLSMELVSFCLYTLAAMRYDSTYSVEAGIKYFIYGCATSGYFLFGSSLFFLVSGSTNFCQIRGTIYHYFEKFELLGNNPLENLIFGVAIVCIMSLPLFKVAAVPVHYWIADVYEGSPMPITAYFSIVIKLAMSVVLIRFLFITMDYLIVILNYLLVCIGLLSVLFGTLAALMEQKIKRIFAFSSISHTGYILLGLAPYNPHALSASLNYLLVYVFTNVIIFSFLLLCTSIKVDAHSRYLVYIGDLGLLQRKNFMLSACFSIALLSFAGIPPFGGFFVKFNIFSVLWDSDYAITVIFLILTSLISTFYYLRFIKCLFFSPNTKGIYMMHYSTWNSFFMVLFTLFLVFYPFFANYLTEFFTIVQPHCDFIIHSPPLK